MTAIETVWQHIKSAAHDFAKDGRRLNERDAEALIVRFCREARVSPWPSSDVIAFYAEELLQMIDRDRFTVR